MTLGGTLFADGAWPDRKQAGSLFYSTLVAGVSSDRPFDFTPTHHSTPPTLHHSSNTPTRPYAPLLPCHRQIAIEFSLFRFTENSDSSVMCLNDLASD
jgi:hypothetical protein